MPTRRIETDYLVVGCGAAGMAFADSLIDASRADVIMVDRRHGPGGRLNMLRGLPQRNGEPRVLEASARFAANLRQGLENLERLCISSNGA